ncbi:MAG TPA: AAA family ATPase [Acidimicrobiales bacterium]
MSRLDLVIGPNGAGKSTFIRLILVPAWPAAAVVNADEIARQRWPEAPEVHSYESAAIAAATRSRLIELRRPLIAETVFSHPSKLDLMDEASGGGYYIALHVILVPEDLAVARVAYRHAAGGHDVPEEKIRGRYARLWELVAVAVGKADAAMFWDNTGIHGPLQVAAFIGGLAVTSPTWPAWAPSALTLRWPG